MKQIWDLVIHGYIPLRCDNQRTKKLSIKLLVLVLIISVILYKYLS
jgi:hypothetical protein